MQPFRGGGCRGAQRGSKPRVSTALFNSDITRQELADMLIFNAFYFHVILFKVINVIVKLSMFVIQHPTGTQFGCVSHLDHFLILQK